MTNWNYKDHHLSISRGTLNDFVVSGRNPICSLSMGAGFQSSTGVNSSRSRRDVLVLCGTLSKSSGVTGRSVKLCPHLAQVGFWYYHIHCQFIAEEWEWFSDADAFWSEYSNPETHNKLSYQQILNRLVVCWADKAAQDAADAREFFGGNLDCLDADGAFQYSKHGRTHLISKDDAVAKRWKELLDTRPDITLRLAQMHSAQPAAWCFMIVFLLILLIHTRSILSYSRCYFFLRWHTYCIHIVTILIPTEVTS